MSRIGKKPITVPNGVTVKVLEGAVEVQGPKGTLRQAFPPGINFDLADGHLVARRATEHPDLAKFHGLARSLVANAVTGVTEGFKRELDIVGVGYRGEVKGKQAIFALEPAQSASVVDEDYLDDIAAAFARVVDSKSPYTIGHSERVTVFSDLIAEQLGLAPERRRWLKRAALLHDIGKLGVSNAILDKAGKLDADEWEAMKLHAAHTETILSRIAAFDRTASTLMSLTAFETASITGSTAENDSEVAFNSPASFRADSVQAKKSRW